MPQSNADPDLESRGGYSLGRTTSLGMVHAAAHAHPLHTRGGVRLAVALKKGVGGQ